MAELLIIADDLTGAIETGVHLAKQGISTKVILNSEGEFQQIFSEIDCSVLIVNTESRHIHPKEAAERVRRVLKKGYTAGIKRFYKKTDSTMRGNIGVELEAFMNEATLRTLAFIPAHPALKRFTRKGFHYIDEVLLHETDFGKDPFEPIEQSNISEILRLQTGIKINSIDVTKEEHRSISDGILIIDCNSIQDLMTIGDFLLNKDLSQAIAGSAAMVELLPQLLQLNVINLKSPKLHGPTLIVNGSLNRISLEQVKYAHDKDIKMISIPQELLSDISFYNNPHFISLRSIIKFTTQSGQDIILNTTPFNDQPDVNLSIDEHLKSDHFEFIAKQIGLIITAILEEVQFSTLAVFGGDTISGIMEAMSCEYIEPELEIIPGVAVSLAKVKNNYIQLVSKPGGYGGKEVILNILDYINQSRI